jgi:hypothetical protein
VRLDVADRHGAGVEVQHPVIESRQAGLALADQLGLERPLAIARGAHGDLAELGLERLGRVAVAMVADPARRRLPRRIAEMLAQLGAQRGLHHPARELRDQPARTGDLLRRQPRQRLIERVGGQQPRKPIQGSLTGTLNQRAARRATHIRLDFLLGHEAPSSAPPGPRRSPRPHTEDRTEPSSPA